MGDRKAKLDRYRDQIIAVFTANIKAVLKDGTWTEEEQAGTLALIASSAVSFAAFQVAVVTPHLRNAPPEAQLADFMETLATILTSKPLIPGGLKVVHGGKGNEGSNG